MIAHGVQCASDSEIKVAPLSTDPGPRGTCSRTSRMTCAVERSRLTIPSKFSEQLWFRRDIEPCRGPFKREENKIARMHAVRMLSFN